MLCCSLYKTLFGLLLFHTIFTSDLTNLFPQAVVLSDKPVISISNSTLSESLLEQLLNDIGSLASVYHKPPETFLGRGRFGADDIQRKARVTDFLAFLGERVMTVSLVYFRFGITILEIELCLS